jgi:hypothetical protein
MTVLRLVSDEDAKIERLAVLMSREETAAEDLRNALQILRWTKPAEQAPALVENNVLAAVARVTKALAKIERGRVA